MQRPTNLLTLTLALTCLSAASFSFSGEPASPGTSIEDRSINWENETDKATVLASAPAWKVGELKTVYEMYQHHSLPANSANAYNTIFINAYWGPLNNPFVIIARPAKAFAFVTTNNSNINVVAPLIHDTDSGNYYVFDKDQSQPVLLNDWIAGLRKIYGNRAAIRFNVCNGYGSNAKESCNTTSYQQEIADSIHQSDITLRVAAVKNASAKRGEHEDWLNKVNTMLKLNRADTGDSIYHSSIDWNNSSAKTALLNTVVSWPDYQTIQSNFLKIRDMVYFQENRLPIFKRRISWLFPDDGCWTRASAVIKDLFGPLNNSINKFPRPSKVFAFGNLCANTPNAPGGKVSWWYHTAPIVRDAVTQETWVLDPSVNPLQPMTLNAWITAISSPIGKCADSSPSIAKINICNGYGSGPYESCKNTTYNSEADSVTMQPNYQTAERERQTLLGRDADKVLGDTPPWL